MKVTELYLRLTNSFVEEISKEIDPRKIHEVEKDLREENPLLFDDQVFDTKGRILVRTILDRSEDHDDYLLRTLRYFNKRLINLYGEEIMPLRAYEKYNDCLETVKEDGEKEDLWTLLSYLPEDTALDDRIDRSLKKEMREKFRRRTRQFLESKDRYKLLFESIGQPVFVLDLELRLVEMNTASSNFFEKENYEILGSNIFEMGFFQEEDKKKFYENTQRIIRREEKSINEKYNIIEGENREEKILEITTTGLVREDEILLIINVCRDITKQVSLQKDLRESLEEKKQLLEEKEEMEEKKEFLNTLIRQDLRSRVQTVQGYLQLLEEADLSETEKGYLKDALKTGQQSDEIISMAKKLKEMEETEMDSEKEISGVMDKAIDEVSEISKRESIVIERNYPDKIGRVKGDYTLKTLFSNILRMRAHVPNCDKIQIAAEETDEEVFFKFIDDGDQLPDEIKDLFSGKGYTGETTGASGAKYYMLKQIAEHNDARISVKDSELGGARFDVHLRKTDKDAD